MSASAIELVDPMDYSVPYDALARSLRATIESLAAYRVNPSWVFKEPNSRLINGGFGDIVLARLDIGAHVYSATIAVKKLRPGGDEIQRLRVAVALARELLIWAGLDHPNIATLVGFHLDMSCDEAWLISRWEPLGNIIKYLADNQHDEETRLHLALDTANGLAYLHSRRPSVCHGDIKGANVLVNRYRRAMWCDFGLAQALDCGPSGLTTSRSYTGTAPYVSAELLNGDTGRTLKSDVWAWGCVFLEVMVDRRPYQGKKNEMAIMLAIAQGELPAAIDSLPIPDFGREVLAKCWSLDAASRPTMTWCSEVLTRRTTALFSAYCRDNFVTIPSEYKSERDGLHLIHNPDSEKVYEFDFLPSTRIPDIFDFAFSPDGRSIALVTAEAGPMGLYNVETGQMQSEVDCPNNDDGNKDDFYTVCFSHSGSLLATGHESGIIRIWDTSTWTLRRELKGLGESISSITFSHSDVILASIDDGDSLRTWNVQNGTLLQLIPDTSHDIVIGSFHHPFVLASSSFGRPGTMYDVELGRRYNQPQFAGLAIFMPDGEGLISGNADGGLTTWDLRPLLEHRERISDGEISSSNRDEPKLSGTTIEGPQDRISALSASSDGQLLASGSFLDDNCVLWDLTNRRPLLRIHGHKFFVLGDVCFQPGSTASQGMLAYTYGDLVTPKLQLLRYKLTS